MKERDNSYFAMKQRYDRANLQAIAMHNRLGFDSLQDVVYLIDKCKKMEQQIEELKAEIQTLISKE